MWPQKDQLARRWEGRAVLREQMRAEKRLLVWPSKATTGVASLASLRMNRFAIADIVAEWASVCSEPRSPPIAWIRQEAGLGGLILISCHPVSDSSGSRWDPQRSKKSE